MFALAAFTPAYAPNLVARPAAGRASVQMGVRRRSAGTFGPCMQPQTLASRALSWLWCAPWQEKSKAIPFLPAAPALDGTMAGDKGFDPLLLSNIVPLKWAREVRSVAVAVLPLRGRASRGSGLTLSGSACRRS